MMYLHRNWPARILSQSLCALALVLVDGCSESSLSTAPELNSLWRRATRIDSRPVESTYPVVWEDQFIVALSKPGDSTILLSLRQSDGYTIWQRALGGPEEKIYYNLQSALDKNMLVLPVGKTTHAINSKNGQILWSFKHRASPEPFIENTDGGMFWRAINDWEKKESFLTRMDSRTGETKDMYRHLWPDSSVVLLRTPLYINNNEIIFTAIFYNSQNQKTQAYWYVASTDQSYVIAKGTAYQDNLKGYGVTKQPILTEDKIILLAYDQLFCLDRITYQEKWRIKLPRDMLTSQPIIDENQIYCALEDGYLYSIYANNGSIHWKSPIAETPSRIEVFGNHLFLIGGQDGMLYSIDKTNGRRIRSMHSPNHYYKDGEFFHRCLSPVTAQGRMLLYDGSHFRCYSVLTDF